MSIIDRFYPGRRISGDGGGASMQACANVSNHAKAFCGISARLGLVNGYRDSIFPALHEQVERIEEVHDLHPGPY